MFNPNKRGGSVDRAYLNNNMILQNNIQIQNQNNMINFFNMCPMMVMMNCLGDFNNIGGGGAKNIFPMNQFNNNMNQINNNVNCFLNIIIYFFTIIFFLISIPILLISSGSFKNNFKFSFISLFFVSESFFSQDLVKTIITGKS